MTSRISRRASCAWTALAVTAGLTAAVLLATATVSVRSGLPGQVAIDGAPSRPVVSPGGNHVPPSATAPLTTAVRLGSAGDAGPSGTTETGAAAGSSTTSPTRTGDGSAPIAGAVASVRRPDGASAAPVGGVTSGATAGPSPSDIGGGDS